MIAPSHTTLRDWLQRSYLPRRIDLAPGSRLLLVTAVNRLETWSGGRVQLDDLADRLVLDHLRDFSATRAAATANSQRRMLLELWRAAADERLCDPPAGRIPRFREPEPEPEAWTVEQFGRLLAYCQTLQPVPRLAWRSDWWTSIWSTVYWTGARIGALLKICIDDYHGPEQVLHVRPATQKTRQGKRFRLSPQAAEWIGRNLRHDPDRALLWPWPFDGSWLWRQARAIVERAGLSCPRGRGRQLFHRGRRTCITYCWMRSPAIAQHQAGHTTAAMTKRHYVDQAIIGGEQAADVLPSLHF